MGTIDFTIKNRLVQDQQIISDFFNNQEGQNYPCSNQIVICGFVTEDNSKWKEFINQNFLKVFSLYYNKGKELKSILIGGKVIPISKKTKDFSCLLKNNKQIEKELIEAAELVYSNQNIFNVSLDIKEQK